MVERGPRKELVNMKKNRLVYLFLALLCVWCPVFVGFRYSQQIRNMLPVVFVQAWDKNVPAASTSLRNSNPQMLTNQSALESAIGQDHEFSTGGTNSGEHTQIKFNVPISTPSNAANKGWLYSKDVSAVVELHWLDESGNELQITSGGDLFSSAGLIVTSASTFNGSITLGAGDDLIGSSTSDITFNTNKFTVAGATGNTVIAGTLGVTGIATLGDASTLATSAAPTADAEIANKKYVDDQDTADHPTYSGGESHTDGSGLIMKMGLDTTHTGDHTGGTLKATVTFEDAFPTGVVAIVPICVDENELGNVTVTLHDVSTTIFDYTLKEASAGVQNMSGVYWIAIGY